MSFHSLTAAMQLSRWSYRADFVVYPLLVALAVWLPWAHATRLQAQAGVAAMAFGWLCWTGIEYSLHRWLLHRVQPFKRLHDAHHASPSACIGTPTWLSAPLFLGVWAALAAELPHALAAGFAGGLMLGYLLYALVHDAVHHRRAKPGSWLHNAKLRHARHHRPSARTDFGVSTGVWDRGFATASAPRVASPEAAAALRGK